MTNLKICYVGIPVSFLASVFVGYKLLKRWQHQSVHSFLEQSLLELWKIRNKAELVEYVKVTLQKLCLSDNQIFCFISQDNHSYFDYASGQWVTCDFASQYSSRTGSYCRLTPSSDTNQWLVQNDYVAESSQAFLFFIGKEDEDESELFIFLVSGKSLTVVDSIINSFTNHATACLGRLPASAWRRSENDRPRSESVFPDRSELDRLDALSMQIQLNSYFLNETLSDGCCFLFKSSSINQIVCYAVDQSVLDYKAHYPIDTGFFAEVFASQQPNYLTPIEEHSQGEKELCLLFNIDIKSALCVPIVCEGMELVQCLVCLCSKDEREYSAVDVAVVNAIMSDSHRRLSSLLRLHEERERREQCETMLKIAKNLFTHLEDVGQLLGEVIQEARNLTNSERCSVFLVDHISNELVAKVFDGIVTAEESLDPSQYDFENMQEVRIPLSRGVAGHVATTGKLLNIVDAYSHPLFYQGIDDSTGFKTRNILCFPIKDHLGAVVGVAELCNKIKGHCFTTQDEKLAERFAVFCGISLSHSLMYKAIEESGSRNQLANELVAFHMKVDVNDIKENIPREPLEVDHFDPEFDDFVYRPRDLADDLKIKACIFMYEDLGLISAFHIPMRVLVHFLLMVRKGYRDPPYHNWDHAFSVMHHGYLIAKNLNLNKNLSNLEVISLLTACVCHDLDHRGTNNAFQINSQSLLANLYSSEGSVLERHHFAQAVCIISTSGCNIFENMKRKDYSNTLALMKHLVLATDVATHLKIMPKLEAMANRGLELNDPTHRRLILALSMTASDLSDQTKDWSTTLNTSKLIYKEFFYQGDMEKQMGNSPAIINDREKACVPAHQIKFMEHIALPVYRIMGSLFFEYEIVHRRVIDNLQRWRRVENRFRALHLQNRHSLDFLTDDFSRDLFKGIDEA